MERPPDSLKSIADRLARCAMTRDGAEALRLWRLAESFGSEPDDRPRSDGLADAERVGIWERKNDRDGATYFVRSKARFREWHLWANVGRIDPKGRRRRVVLIGESVARGYLYDPEFTPAMALKSMLEPSFPAGAIDVVDLARSDLAWEIADVALAARHLDPDAIVVFAGNNWQAPSIRSCETDAALRADGVRGLSRVLAERLGQRAARLAREVNGFYSARNIPVVWIIPEFNLGDWRDPDCNAPHLPVGNREWLLRRESAEQALAAGDLEAAPQHASRMIELDGGTAAPGYYLLADCRRRAGDVDGARRCLELARDAASWDASRPWSPRARSVVQDALRAECRGTGAHVVDLPAVFRAHLDGGIPDRRLFLDYCHLTIEGLQLAMGAAASPILRELTGTTHEPIALTKRSGAPSAAVRARAAFLAAIHNAHWYQPYDLVRHFCAEAVRVDPSVAGEMITYLDLQTASGPMWSCGAAARIVERGTPSLSHYLLRANKKQLDRVLLGAVVDSLEAAGVECRERLAALRRDAHSVHQRSRDLLDYYYCSAAYQPLETFWVLDEARQGARVDFYRAYGRESRFPFVAEADRPVVLQLTCRLPPGERREGAVSLRINDAPQGQIAIDSHWSTWQIVVSGTAVVDGVNELAIRWPMPEFPGQAALDAAADDVLLGFVMEPYPVFGEVHALTASGPNVPCRSGVVPVEERPEPATAPLPR